MRSTLADYQILGPAGPDADSWVAAAPARLGLPTSVVVTVVAGRPDWTVLAPQLESLAAVRSPFLPQLIEGGQSDEEDGPVTWVVREEGRPRPGSGGASDPRAALRRLAAAARGAHDLHEAGWLHGDIRPAALLERGDDALLEPPLRRLAPSGPVTPGSAPVDLDTIEPASIWGEGPSRATDIWALGATAHRVLTGRPVHPALEGDLIVTAVQRVLIEPPVVAPSLPLGVAQLLRSCLEADPADRPPTAADLADGFERLAAGR